MTRCPHFVKRRPQNVHPENSLCAAVAYPVPVRLAVRRAAVLLRLRVQTGKRTALLLAFAVLITYSVKNGIILLMLAFLISPMGLPLLAVQGLGKLQDMNTAMKNFIHS